LNTATMAAIAAGVSTRRYAKTVDQLPPDEHSSATSGSAVSRRFSPRANSSWMTGSNASSTRWTYRR